MTAIWTPSKELWTPKHPAFRRRVSEWCRMAAGAVSTCGGKVNTKNGKVSTNANQTGGCGCGGCRTICADGQAAMQYTRTFQFSGLTPVTTCCPSPVPGAGLDYVATQYQCVQLLMGGGQVGALVKRLAKVSNYLGASCPSCSIVQNYRLNINSSSSASYAQMYATGPNIFTASMSSTGSVIPPGTYPSQVSAGADCGISPAPVMVVSDVCSYWNASSLPSSVTISGNNASGYLSCVPTGSTTASATGSLLTTTDYDSDSVSRIVGVTYAGTYNSYGPYWGASSDPNILGERGFEACGWYIKNPQSSDVYYFSPTLLGNYYSLDPADTNVLTVSL